ncbi:hypothetical protein AB0D08_33590 [Kitasatospora sp. NPDC048540]|uniref:hypothetical protein n=1 Tax=unclassified Kitasatospora TaxID=2633591 RepID=UPI0006897E8E|nr:hypothetical protein [Kitasatospora sp. MBT63]
MSGHPYGPPGHAAGGPHHPALKALYALLPLLTVGLLGLVPSVVLAARRRRPADLAGAVVIGAVQLAVYVCLGLTPDNSQGSPYSIVGGLLLIALAVGAPVHFLVMDRAAAWFPGRPAPHPAFPAHPQPYGPSYGQPHAQPYPQPYGQPATPPPTPGGNPYATGG